MFEFPLVKFKFILFSCVSFSYYHALDLDFKLEEKLIEACVFLSWFDIARATISLPCLLHRSILHHRMMEIHGIIAAAVTSRVISL